MALEPGGYADKLGNRYEGRWIARQLLLVLNEDIKSVTVEAIGDDEVGIDLWINRPDGSRQCQQCKIRNLSKDNWNMAALSSRGILSAMKTQLDRDPSYEFALVTAIPFTTLHDICTSARMSTGDSEAFFRHQIQNVSEARRKTFTQFSKYLSLDVESEADRSQAYSYLKRIFIELWPDTIATQQDLNSLAEMLLEADGATAIAILADFAQDNLRKTIDASALRNHLKNCGIDLRRLASDDRTLPAIEELKDLFLESIKCDLIAGELIPRSEATKIAEALSESAVVVVHGNPGQGKSGVLYELCGLLEQSGSIYLPLRLDRQEPRNTPQQFGADLGLRESPVFCLDAISSSGPAVLILDQLDAIRWTSRHSLNSLDVCRSLVREVKHFRRLGKPISVVLACRTYDLRNDPEIRNWIHAEKNKKQSLVEITIEPLTETIIEQVASNCEVPPPRLTQRQKQILTSPQQLAMWVRIVHSSGQVEFRNRVQLMREFWRDRMRELGRLGYSSFDVDRALTEILNYMEANSSVSAPLSLLPDGTLTDALCSGGLIQVASGQVTFSHQSYLDYKIANRLVREIHSQSGDVCDWLGGRDTQSLFRREQLRQVLCLLSEESPDTFLEVLTSILTSPNIRFHLKHLCLEVVGQLETPTEELHVYLKQLSSEQYWQRHVFSNVYVAHSQYVEWLIDNGTVTEWLENDSWRDLALWILRWVAESLGDKVANVLGPYVDSDQEWQRCVHGCLPWQAEQDSDDLFEVRLRLARQGVVQQHIDWDKLPVSRRLSLLDAIITSLKPEDLPHDYSGGRRGSSFEHLTDEDWKALTGAAAKASVDTWELLIPHISRLAPNSAELTRALELWLDQENVGIRYGMETVPHLLVRLCIEAGRALASTNSEEFWNQTKPLRSSDSPVIRFIAIESYANLLPTTADEVLGWLIENPEFFSVGTGDYEPEWMPTARLIAALSEHCSEENFRRLEQAIIHYHSPDERSDAEYWLPSWKKGYFGDYWGRAQYFLLPNLAHKRVSTETIGLIGVLNHKFADYSERRFTLRSAPKGGFVRSTLPSTSLERISDKAWLSIVENKQVPEERGELRHYEEGHIEESTVVQFSHQLRVLAKRFPERFGRLAIHFPSDVAPKYKAAILEGMKQTEPKEVPEAERELWRPASVETIEAVLSSFGTTKDTSYAREFCWLMYERAEDKWSQDAIETLVNYAKSHPHPDPGRLTVYLSNKGQDSADATVWNLEEKQLNTVRSVAMLAIGEQLWHHPTLLGAELKAAITEICNDEHPAVLAAAVRGCLPILNIDKDFAMKCFCTVVSNDIRVAATRAAVYYFNVGMLSHYDQVSPIVLQMLTSSKADVAEEGAAEVAARWVFHGHFDSELQSCISGEIPHRKGIAKVAADLIRKSEYMERCSSLVDVLKDDSEPEVRRLLCPILRSSNILESGEGIQLVLRLIDSETFKDDPEDLLYALKQHTGTLLPFSKVLFAIAEQFAGPLRESSQDASRRIMHDASQLFPLLIRLYEQADEASNRQIINKCLDAFDQMFEMRVGMINDLTRLI